MSKCAIVYDSEEVKNHLQDIHDGAFVDDEDLQELLAQAWYLFVPEDNQKEITQAAFVSSCFNEKEKYLIALNGEYQPSTLSLIGASPS